MTVTVVATDLRDAANQIGIRDRRSAIHIDWRRGTGLDGPWEHALSGCIVDATSIPGEETKRAFSTAADALRYIAVMLNKHEAYANEQQQKRANEARLAKALSKKKCDCK